MQWLRAVLLLLVMLAIVVLPFLLWGDRLEHRLPQWLAGLDGRWLIALVGIVLLVADIGLPVPSSVIAMALCWSLGPLWGGLAVAVGTLLAFAAGYGLGRLVPESRLRHWVGDQVWQRVTDLAHRRALWWIVMARPLPVLAEVSAVLAGVWRVPLLPAFAAATLASALLAIGYALSAWLGRQTPGGLSILVFALALPALFWLASRRLLGPASGASQQAHR